MPESLLPGERASPLTGPRPSPHWGKGEECSMRQAFVAAVQVFREAGIETPELDSRLLLCHAASLSHEVYMARLDLALRPETARRLDDFVARRLKREPIARILGGREFYGRSFLIDRHTLDPRADTETLIEAALDLVGRHGWRERPLTLLDLGTGTGCILVTLLAELPRATGIGTDLSAAALSLARANACRLGVQTRAAFVAADWLDAIVGEFDLILSNPPYVPAAQIAELAPEVAGYDPALALDGGPDGLDAYRRIAAKVSRALRPGGCLIVEIGAGHADAVLSLLRTAGLRAQEDNVRRDLAGQSRAIVAESG
jgi:release factor glutamine methyltransferase